MYLNIFVIDYKYTGYKLLFYFPVINRGKSSVYNRIASEFSNFRIVSVVFRIQCFNKVCVIIFPIVVSQTSAICD